MRQASSPEGSFAASSPAARRPVGNKPAAHQPTSPAARQPARLGCLALVQHAVKLLGVGHSRPEACPVKLALDLQVRLFVVVIGGSVGRQWVWQWRQQERAGTAACKPLRPPYQQRRWPAMQALPLLLLAAAPAPLSHSPSCRQ